MSRFIAVGTNIYKREKTGWQMVAESDTETLPTPKCPEMDAEMKTLKHLTSR